MTDETEESLFDILHEVLHLLPREVDFTQTTSEALPEIVRSLSTAATIINLLALRQYGGRVSPPRGSGLVEQIVGAAFQTFGGSDPHPEPFDKAAMLLRGVTGGHPFADGNKRTGFLLAMYYLEQVGIPAPQSLDRAQVVEFCRQVSAGEVRDLGAIKRELIRLWRATLPLD